MELKPKYPNREYAYLAKQLEWQDWRILHRIVAGSVILLSLLKLLMFG